MLWLDLPAICCLSDLITRWSEVLLRLLAFLNPLPRSFRVTVYLCALSLLSPRTPERHHDHEEGIDDNKLIGYAPW
jgi:hypothetical protein